MSADRPATRTPTDEQLADILRFIARTCLEVERGLRPPAHLLEQMDPASRSQWSRSGKIGRFHGGAVHDDQVGQPHLTRVGDGEVVATVVTRTEGDRWGAITLRMHATDEGRWRIVDLQRLLATSHKRAGPSQSTPPEVTAEWRLEIVGGDRRLAEAAHQAATTRLGDLARGAPGYRAARELVRYWADKLGELDQELTDLRTRHDTRQHIQRLLRR